MTDELVALPLGAERGAAVTNGKIALGIAIAFLVRPPYVLVTSPPVTKAAPLGMSRKTNSPETVGPTRGYVVTQAEFESATFGFGGRRSPRDFKDFGDLDGCRRLATALVSRFENSLRTARD